MKLISNIISVLAFSGAAVATQAAERPNVIIVFIDDFGYGDLGCYGSTKHRTPHIDQMAKEGIRLTDFYVGSSVSTPSRSALLTGCYPRRVSMHVNADPTPLMSKGRQVLFPASHKGLNPGEITIAELMKEQGYATACIGKWHLGDQLPFLPTRQGFDYYYGIPYSNDMDRPYCPLPLMEQEEVIVAPVGHDSLTIRYTNKTVELDWSMGVLLETLKEEGLDQNTLIIFTSDNGADEHFGGTNRPLRGQKGTTYEGGFRVPCIMRWPAKIPAGQETDNLVTSMDFLPTLAHYCGYAVPSDRVIDGHNVSGILEGESMASPTETFYYYQKQQLQAVRWGNWKYHLPLKERIKGPHFPDTEVGEARLYNLANDLSETTNVIDKHPEVVTKMNQWIEQVRSDMGDWGYEGRNQRPAGIIDEPFPRLLK